MSLSKCGKNKKGKKNMGIVGSFIRPVIDVTGEQLLNTLRIRGEFASVGNTFTDGEIYIALTKCKYLLNRESVYFEGSKDLEDSSEMLSGRQYFCSNATIQLIMQNEFNPALHEFEDCIDDYGKGKVRTITVNEYVLYNCILNCFIARLEERSDDLGLIKTFA